MASYDKSKDVNYTLAVQSALKTLGADLGAAGVDGKWGAYTERAYQQNRQTVDALVSGIGFSGAGAAGGTLAPAFTPQLVDVPEQRSFADWLSVGQEIYNAQYEAGRVAAERRLASAQAANEENRVQSAARLETAANARGFGRSSYATDMLQRNEYEANRNDAALQGDYADALLQLEANRNASAASYAGSMWQSQQQAVLEAQRFNAQQSQEAALRQWEAENELRKAYYEASAAYASSARSSSGKRSSSSSSSGKKASETVLEEEEKTPTNLSASTRRYGSGAR
ncbi:MAG: hypothetical protein ACOX83_10090 [Candidatus Spyradocola sp.]|jgi:hypothetical protein